LESLLILPIQRIPQYNLLLNDLFKNTWPHHPDYKNLKAATKIMKEIASVVNEKKRESENIKKVAELGTKIIGFPQLAVPHRRFVSETKFKNIAIDNTPLQPERTVVVFVFNDIVLLTIPQGDKYEVEIYSYFGRVSLDDAPSGPNKERAIRLKLKEKVYTLLCQNEKEKTSWVVTFLNTVQLARKLEAEQRRISAQRHNLALKLSSRPSKEDLVESGILSKDALTPRESSQSDTKTQKTESGVVPKKTPRGPKKSRNSLEQDNDEEDLSQDQEEGEEDAEEDMEATDSSQEAVWITYPTFEAIQQALSCVPNFTSSDLQNILDQRRGHLRFITSMDIHTGKKKIQTNLLAITDFRLLFINKGKVVHEAHILDIAAIRSKEPNELYLQFKNFVVEGVSEHADAIINQIRRVFMTNFPGMPESAWFALDVQPESRLEKLPVDTYANSLPCGGFVDSYKSLCDFLDIEPRTDIIWDIKHLHATQKISEFNFKHFELPDEDDQYRALMAALRYNSYFTSLVCKDIKTLTKDSMTAIMNLFKYNVAITDIIFANSNFNRDSYVLLADALTFNKRNCNLKYLDLSNTLVEDKGIVFLVSYIERVNNVKLEHLNLSGCAIGPKGLTALFQAFRKSTIIDTLIYLNISDNKLERDASSMLATWLAIPNKTLQVLKISNTQAKLSTIINGLMRGCPQLNELDISKNKFSDKCVPALVRYIQGSYSLQRLNISGLNLTPEHFGELWTAIHENVYLKQLSLDASLNNFGLPGAFIICQHFEKCHGIVELILKDNDFGDEGVGNICAALTTAENAAVESLVLDGNFKWKNQRERITTVKKIAALLSAPNCKLKKLSITGGPKSNSQLKHDLAPALLALAQNFTLEELNVTGHKLGNKGLFALARALQTNTSLKTLLWDENALTVAALERLVTAMKYNLTLCSAPIPAQDLSPLFLQSDAPLQQHIMSLIAEFQNLLGRNYYKKEEEIKKQQQLREQQRESQHRLKQQQLQQQTLRRQGSLPPPKKPRKTYLKGLLALTSQGPENLNAKPKAKQTADKKAAAMTKPPETKSSKAKLPSLEENQPTRPRETSTTSAAVPLPSTPGVPSSGPVAVAASDVTKEPATQTKGKKVGKRPQAKEEKEKEKERVKPRKEIHEAKEGKGPKKVQPPVRKASGRLKEEPSAATTPPTVSASQSTASSAHSSASTASATSAAAPHTTTSKRHSAKNPKKTPTAASHSVATATAKSVPITSQQQQQQSSQQQQQSSASTADGSVGGLTIPPLVKKADKKSKHADRPKKVAEKYAVKKEKKLSKFELERLELIQGLMKRDLSKELAESPVASLFAKPPLVTPTQTQSFGQSTAPISTSTSPLPPPDSGPAKSVSVSESKQTSPSPRHDTEPSKETKEIETGDKSITPPASFPPPLAFEGTILYRVFVFSFFSSHTADMSYSEVESKGDVTTAAPSVVTTAPIPTDVPLAESEPKPSDHSEESEEEGPFESVNEPEEGSVESEGNDETPPAPPSIEEIEHVMKSPTEEKTAIESHADIPELKLGLVDISSVPPPPPLTGRDLTGSDLIGHAARETVEQSDTSDEGEGDDDQKSDVTADDQKSASSEEGNALSEDDDDAADRTNISPQDRNPNAPPANNSNSGLGHEDTTNNTPAPSSATTNNRQPTPTSS